MSSLASRLRTFGFSPKSLSGLVGWFDTSQITGKNDGDAVSQWDDLSGLGNHFTQATGANQPLYKTGGKAGRPYLLGDGSNDLMAANGLASTFSGAVAYTVFLVAHQTTTTSDLFLLSMSNHAVTNAYTGFASGTLGTTKRHRITHRTAASNTNYEAVFDPSTGFARQMMRRNGAALRLHVNDDPNVAGVGQDITVTRVTLGARVRTTTDGYSAGRSYEVIVYNRALTDGEVQRVEKYLDAKYARTFGGPELSGSSTTVTGIYASTYGIANLVDLASVTGASALREQDAIIQDPGDPNLVTNPERLWKFYFSALVSGASTIWVVTSPDGRTFGTPTQCTFTGSRASEDPSIVQEWSTPGVAHRHNGDLVMYVEDSATRTIYCYTSTDGFTWTATSGNPVIGLGSGGSWEGYLVGSPCGRYRGTTFIVGYEGIDALGAGQLEAMGIASGSTPNSLTKSVNNPVWHPTADPHAIQSIVMDHMYEHNGKVVLTAHSGKSDGLEAWRAQTTVLDPTAWTAGDIATVGIDINPVRNDLTVDWSSGHRNVLVSSNATDDAMVRVYVVEP